MSLIKRFCYWVLAIFLVAFAAAVLFANSLLLVETNVKPAQIIIVLGGGGEERPARALELLRKGSAPRLLLSGAGEDPSMRAKLRAEKIPDARIVLESKSTSTTEKPSLASMREVLSLYHGAGARFLTMRELVPSAA